MTKRDRVRSVLEGRPTDHTPVSFWHHFPPAQQVGTAAVQAHVEHLEPYDLDFLKVMNDHRFPRGRLSVLTEPADLKRIEPLPGDTEGLADQLQVLRDLRRLVGPDVPMTTTLFNPWAVLRGLTEPPSDIHNPPKLVLAEDQRDEALSRLLKADRAAVTAALNTIAQTLADFARLCIEAGADGVFLSVRDDWVNRPANGGSTAYDELVRRGDIQILQAAGQGWFNWVHMCGKPQDFAGFAAYPCAVVNWADRAAGPSIAYARDRVRPAIAAGVDNLKTLPEGTPAEVAAEVRDALRQAGQRPIMITPGCTYDPQKVPAANLQAMVNAARGAA